MFSELTYFYFSYVFKVYRICLTTFKSNFVPDESTPRQLRVPNVPVGITQGTRLCRGLAKFVGVLRLDLLGLLGLLGGLGGLGGLGLPLPVHPAVPGTANRAVATGTPLAGHALALNLLGTRG